MKQYIALLAVFVGSAAVACPITVVNDSAESIIVFELVNAQSAYLEPNQEVTVGSKKSHPHIYVATVGYHGQLQPIDYELEMVGCSMSKDAVKIPYSWLQANEVPAFLALTNLKYKKHQRPHAKVVGERAPQKECGRCKTKKQKS